MITPSFALTATERVLPRLALDFTTASLDARVTFTRTTNSTNPATYVDSNGVVTAATNNQPRFDYDPVSLVCKGLLIEESRTNKILQSENFSATWTNLRSSNVLSAETSPGGVAAYKLTEDSTASNTHSTSQSITAVTGAHTISVWAKASGRPRIILSALGGTTPRVYGYNLNNGTTFTSIALSGVSTADLPCYIKQYPNGWYLCQMSWTADGQNIIRIYLDDGSAPTYTGDGTSGVYVWGAQLEAGAFPTSYIPTTTTALTRNADVATMTGTNFSDFWNNTEGAFSVFWTQYFLKTTAQIFVFAAQGSLRAPQTTNGSRYYGQTSGNTFALPNISTTAQNGVCVAYQANTAEVISSKASAILTNNASFTGAAPTQFAIGHDGVGTNQISGHFQKILYWPQRLTNAEVQAFSKG